MPHTKEEIIKIIDLDEPDYSAIASVLTKDDEPILVQLSKNTNPAIATKAISCLGRLSSPAALAGIEVAASHADPVYRVAAAHALRNMSTLSGGVNLLDKLLDDKDIGVKKFALKSVEHSNISSLKEKVRQVNTSEQNEGLKILSQQILQKLN